MADAGFLELQQGTEPATPSAGLDRVYVDSVDDHLKHKRPDGTVIDLDTGGTSGSVTSVALSAPAEFVVSGSPVTSAGTLTLTKANENPNTVWAGPTSGAAVQPTFRSLVSADIPNLDFSQITTGTVPISRGGTNSTTALNNNRVIQSFAGAIVEANAITPNQALISDSSGIPTESATTSTELSYVSGVTSSIQTQLNSKQALGTYINQLTGDVSAAGPGSAVATVNSVGGSTSANIHSAELAANAATNNNIPNVIVKRDSSGNFSAGTITASLTGNVIGNVTGSASNNVLKAGDTMTGTLNTPEVILTGTTGTGFVEYPRQTSTPSTPASGHGFHLYADNTGRFSWIGENGFTRTFDGTTLSANRTYTLPDSSGTLIFDPTSATGDLIYRNSSGVLTRLPIGTTGQSLKVNSGLPGWSTAGSTFFGDGSNGSVTLSGAMTLTNPVYYNILTINTGAALNLAGYPLYCITLDLSNAPTNAIFWNGNNGNSSVATGGGAAPGLLASTYLGGAGNGSAGGASSTTTGAQAAAPATTTPSNGGGGGQGAAGGSGTGGTNAGGILRAGAVITNSIEFGMVNPNALFMRDASIIEGGAGGAGGGGGGGNGTNAGTGGGGGGAGAGVIAIFAQNIITSVSTASGVIQANGGIGGNSATAGSANAGSGGAGGGGGGGYVYLCYANKTGPTITNLINANGGIGGNAGNSNGTGLAGNGGGGGSGGNIDVFNTSTLTGVHINGTTGSIGSLGSGTTGGTSGAAGIAQLSL